MENYEEVLMKNEMENGGRMNRGGHGTPEKPRKHFSRIGFAYALGAAIIFAVQYLVAWVVQRFFPQIVTGYDALLIMSSVSMYLIAMPFLVLLVRRIPGIELSRHKMSVGKWFVAFLMSYAVMYVSNIIGLITTTVIGFFKGDLVGNPLGEIVTEISPLTAVVLMVVCAPIVEEYVFRKLLIDRTAKYGEKTAMVLSGLMFGLFHGNLNQFAYAFTLGVFFGFIYVKTGKLIYTITLHAAINFMGSIPGILMLNSGLYEALLNMSDGTEAIMELFANYAQEFIIYMLFVMFIILLVIIGVICWALSFKKMKCVPGEVRIPKGQWFKTVILNGGMILYSLFWIWQIMEQLLA